MPYLNNDSIKVERLLDGIRPSDMPLAYEALTQMARREGSDDLLGAVEHHQGLEKEKREILARETVQEVKPVMEVSKV